MHEAHKTTQFFLSLNGILFLCSAQVKEVKFERLP